jgi:hypothetical protein
LYLWAAATARLSARFGGLNFVIHHNARAPRDFECCQALVKFARMSSSVSGMFRISSDSDTFTASRCASSAGHLVWFLRWRECAKEERQGWLLS